MTEHQAVAACVLLALLAVWLWSYFIVAVCLALRGQVRRQVMKIKCCDCGTTVISCDLDAETKLSLCVECWSKIPSAVIIERSKDHGKRGHEAEAHEAIVSALTRFIEQ